MARNPRMTKAYDVELTPQGHYRARELTLAGFKLVSWRYLGDPKGGQDSALATTIEAIEAEVDRLC